LGVRASPGAFYNQQLTRLLLKVRIWDGNQTGTNTNPDLLTGLIAALKLSDYREPPGKVAQGFDYTGRV
jgi:hypothetical protein